MDVAVVVLDVIVELPLLELVLVIELGVRLWVDLGSEVKTMKAGSQLGVSAFVQAEMRNHLSKHVRNRLKGKISCNAIVFYMFCTFSFHFPSGFPSHFVWTCFCLVSEQHEQLKNKNFFVFCRVADVVMLGTVVTVVVTMVVVVTTRFTSLVPLVAELVITSVVVEVVTVRLRPLLVISSVVTVVPSLVAVMERVILPAVEVVLVIPVMLVTLLVVTVRVLVITVVVMVVMVVMVVVTVLLMVVAVAIAVALATEVVMVVVLVAVAVVTEVFEVVKVVKTVELVVKVEDSLEFAATSSFLNRASRHTPSPHQIDINPFIRFKSCLIHLDFMI